MMPRPLRLVTLAGVAAFLSSTAALAGDGGALVAQARRAVLVLPFHVAGDQGGYEALGDCLRELLIADLSSFAELAVVDRKHLDRILEEHELSLASLTGKETQIKVGRLTGANLLLSGTFTLVDSKIRIDAHLFDVATSRLVRSRRVTGKVDEWLRAEQKLARALAQALGLEITEAHQRAIDEKPKMNLHFIRGLGYYYGCRYDHAIVEFLKTLCGDEKYVDARYWMARSYLAQGEREHAGIEFERIVREFPDHPLREEAVRHLVTCERTER